MRHIFIIGSKGIPASYGGYETFVDKLTEYLKDNKNLKFHVACRSIEDNKEFEYNNAHCFNIKMSNTKSYNNVLYDVYALKYIVNYVKENNIKDFIVYVLACRIGPFINKYKKQIHKLDGKLYVNPDGHEWLRSKWSKPIKKYWKLSEKLMVKHSDLLVCDSVNIEKYIKETYKKYNPNTTFIAYGADLNKSKLKDNSKQLNDWYKQFDIKKDNYYLIVGRFVPENNYETMIREFMKSNTEKDLVIITNHEGNKLYDELENKLHFSNDSRIKFVGTVYDKELLKKIRENAYGYLHGHSVGGTNPSLIEALSSTKLNLLYEVKFNKEVGQDGALYWSLKENNLSKLINKAEKLTKKEIEEISKKATTRVQKSYSWEFISSEYVKAFGEK